jgi:hypothetical protein
VPVEKFSTAFVTFIFSRNHWINRTRQFEEINIVTAQFIHIDSFPRVSRDAPHRTARGMIAELAREAYASQHINSDHAYGARLIFGNDPYELLHLAEKQADQAVDRRGFQIKKTSNIIFIAVASYPLSQAERSADDGWNEAYMAFCDRVVSWSKRAWNGLRIAIVEHVDEDKIHLHIVVVPRMTADHQIDISSAHPGFGAVAKVIDRQVGAEDPVVATPREKKARQRSAYCHAMRAFQDDFHRQVGAASGQDRLSSTPRNRIAREQALTSQAQRQRHLDLNLQERDVIVDRFQLEQREASIAAREAQLKLERQQMAAERSALEAERLRIKMTITAGETLRQIQSLKSINANNQDEGASAQFPDDANLNQPSQVPSTPQFDVEEFPKPARKLVQANEKRTSQLANHLRPSTPEQSSRRPHSMNVRAVDSSDQAIQRRVA